MLRSISILVTIIALSIAGFVLYTRHQKEVGVCTDCNVILISLPYVDAERTTLYNPTVPTTAFLASLQKTSTVFENAYAPSSWALPSLAALLTGQYPWTLHIWNPMNGLLASHRTLAQALQEHGYETAAYVDGRFLTRDRHFDLGFDTFVDTHAVEYPQDNTGMIFGLARAWITNHHTDGKPFFVFISPNVHPYATSSETFMSAEEIRVANTRTGGPTTAEKQRLEMVYAHQLVETDAELQTLFQTLATLSLEKRTIVVITSDTGIAFGNHGIIGPVGMTLYREDIHIPLVFYIPNRGKDRVLASVETRSIANTILEILSYPSDSSFTGTSLLPYIQRTEVANRTVLSKTIFSPLSVNDTPETRYTNTAALTSAIRGRLQAIRSKDGTTELYALDTDPTEKHNLLEKPELLTTDMRETMRQLFAALTLEEHVQN